MHLDCQAHPVTFPAAEHHDRIHPLHWVGDDQPCADRNQGKINQTWQQDECSQA
jgi:hypothetical protein